MASFDYHLAWRFHFEACRIARRLGLDRPGPVRAPASEPNVLDDTVRSTMFNMIQVDLLFQMFYDKPAAIKLALKDLDMPRILSPASMQPACTTIVFIVWVRILLIVEEFLATLNHHVAEPQPLEEAKRKVDGLCDRLEEISEDWSIVRRGPLEILDAC